MKDDPKKPSQDEVPSSAAPRRPYRQPKLVRHGGLVEITRQQGTSGRYGDDQGQPALKTS